MNNTAAVRHISLDALRGFAVMGILLMNIVAFAMPDMAYMSPSVFGGTDDASIASWATSFLLVDGKMRGLFSLLFGASMMIVADSAAAKGENPAKVHYRRMLWLALFGLTHFFLIWFGDILFLYSTVGCIAFLMRDWDAEKLLKRAILFYAIGFVIYAMMFGGMLYVQYAASLPNASADILASFAEMMDDPDLSGSNVADQLALYQQGYGQIVLSKLQNNMFDPFIMPIFNLHETLPFMMIGMALYKNGFLLGSWEAAQYRRIAIRTFIVGLLVLLPLVWLAIINDFDLVVTLGSAMAWSMPARLLMTVGYAALFMVVIMRWQSHPLIHRVAAAGRAAFTNYLGTSIVMTAIFYGYGLGLYGEVSRPALFLYVIGAWIIMLLWSKPWLQRFRYGPLEWLWRSLARGKPQAMKIK